MMLNDNVKFMQGNEAIVEGAIAAGARFMQDIRLPIY